MKARLAAAAVLAAAAWPALAGDDVLGAGEVAAAAAPARYRLTLGPREYVRLRLEPHHGEAWLVARHGERIAGEAETLIFPAGPQTLTLASDAAQELDLEVRPAKGWERARYTLRLAERRAFQEGDERRIEAERTYFAGERARGAGTAASLREGRTLLTRARELYAALGDRAGEADTLISLGRAIDALGERPAAMELMAEAARLQREQRRDVALSYTLNYLALIHDELGQRELAMSELEEAAAAAQRSGNARVEGVTLNDVALILGNLGDRQEALFFYDQALPLHRAAGNLRGEAVAYASMGVMHDVLGNKTLALEHLQHALRIRRAIGEPREVAIVLNNIGATYFSVDDTATAVAYYRQALDRWREAGDRSGEAATLHNMAHTHDYAGEFQEALSGYEEALRLFQATSATVRAANTQTNLAGLYGRLGDRRHAQRLLEEALATHRATGNRRVASTALAALAIIYSADGQAERAAAAHQEALALRRQISEPALVAQSLRDLCADELRRGDHARAEALCTEALAIHQGIPNRRGQVAALLPLASVFLAQGWPEEAAFCAEQALALAREVSDPRDQAAALYALARVELAGGALASARARLESALDLLETLRARIGSDELRASFLASIQDYYVLLLEVLTRLHRERPGDGFDAQALEAAERARARGLLDILAEALAGVRTGVDPGLRERERKLLRALSVKAERQARSGAGRDAGDEAGRERAREIDALNGELRALQAEMRARSPRYAALVAPQPLRAREIQEQLDEETVLLQYALGRERSWLWRVTRTTLEVHELPRGQDLDALARSFLELARRPDADPLPAGRELGRALLAPVAGRLTARRVVVVPDGALHLVPAAALVSPASGRPLVMDHEVVALPSVSVLALLRQQARGRATAPRTVAVVADPVFDAEDPRVRARLKPASAPAPAVKELTRGEDGGAYARLPGSRREALAVVAQAGSRPTLRALDFEASRATVSGGRLADARIVHFATHGVLDDVRPALSGLVLSLVDEGGRRQDGFLRLHDVYNLVLSADLVVLSACQTGLGQELRGEGLVGLTRGFMYAGARSVLATLWKVDDRATAELVRRFYQSLLGPRRLAPAAALRAAQVSMAQDARWRSPYYWAGFVLQGEWAR